MGNTFYLILAGLILIISVCSLCSYLSKHKYKSEKLKLDTVLTDQDIEGFCCSKFADKNNIKLDNEYLTKEETDKIYLTNTVNETREMEEYRFYRAANESISLYLKNKEKEK